MQSISENRVLVQINNLDISYSTSLGRVKAVDDLSLKIFKGESLGLVGESGCGKSTLALSLLKMLPPRSAHVSGSIWIGGLDISNIRGEELRQFRWKKVAMVFQSAMNSLDPVKTIESQITETILQHDQVSKENAKNTARDLLKTVDLDPSRIANSYPHELSGGMRQRVVIAIALCLNPDLLIADEPTTALDVVVQSDILTTLKALQKKFGVTLILISHDISIMWEMTDRLAVMYAGKIVELGETQKIINSPQHPYTEALLTAVPVLGRTGQRIRGIPGTPPNLIHPPIGCRFAERCLYTFERCRIESPPLIESEGSDAACWLREGGHKT